MNHLIFLLILLYVLVPNIGSYAQSDTIVVNNDMHIISIEKEFFLHKTFTNSERWGRFSSNGLLVIKNNKALLIDTPMTEKETEIMYNYLIEEMGVQIVQFIGGHWHNDCIGGMNFLNEKGVTTILGEKTKQICKEKNLPIPDIAFEKSLIDNFEGIEFECAYFGGGHTIDNIVVYFPQQKILFGGCLVKSLGSQSMGNLSDAVPDEWETTVEKVQERYGKATVVVPGHGNYGGTELLQFTIDLSHQRPDK